LKRSYILLSGQNDLFNYRLKLVVISIIKIHAGKVFQVYISLFAQWKGIQEKLFYRLSISFFRIRLVI